MKIFFITSIFLTAILVSCAICSFSQSAIKMTSPDQQTVFNVFTHKGATFYTVKYNAVNIADTSSLGIELNNQKPADSHHLKFIRKYTINEKYSSSGLHSTSTNYCNGYIVNVESKGSVYYQLEVRVYNNGVAFRYLLNQKGKGQVTKDAFSFNIPTGNAIWYQTNIKYYEGEFKFKPIDSLKVGELLAPPATVQFSNGLFATITEGGLSNFSGMRLEVDGKHVLKANLASMPVLTGNFETPWRVITIAKNLNNLVNNDIIANVSAAPDKKLFPDGPNTQWIKPGKSVWSWLAKNGPVTLENMKRFSKWAGALGIEYNLVDEGWGSWKDSLNRRDGWDMMKELVDYSAMHQVKIWVWKAYPDRKGIIGLKDSTQRKIFFKKCHDIGIAGLKIDFFDSEKQEIIQFYQAALRDAAKYELMIDFHGSNKPTGESRTWPNEMTRESVRGLEYGGRHADQNTIIPFTRLTAGPADYTPLQLGNLKGERSLPHHIATAVTFTSPLLCLAVNPEALLQDPNKDFITGIPSTWDETIVLPQSEIGSLSAFARRKGSKWYLAVINNEKAKALTINLSFLPSGNYKGILLKDDVSGKGELIKEEKIITNKVQLNLDLVASGGFVASFEK